ncbi:Formate/nitrite transporter-domain-containing protein [Immersiella caudata]|uniref:Formate/nitrite transporter-domain-containing protein n=1 Tax=Immersiella caudata TaxID=314043 RepID=A0AA40CCU3_9PEZI|nr:Formate/nitrite transporter-domain-containing protein [Immersiella caudata]
MSNPVTLNAPSMVAYTPAETIELVSRAGARKGRTRPDKTFLGAVSAGCMLSLAAGGSLLVSAIPWYIENAPGIVKMLSAIIFPVALVLIMLTGAELFTGSTMITGVAVLHRRLPIQNMLLHWLLCFWGNFAGCLFVMSIFMGYGGIFDHEPYRGQVIAFVTAKQLDPQWHQIFIRAIGCNWLVCLGIFMGMQGKDVVSKVTGMYMPIFIFVMLGFDHVAANMFFIPLGIWLGTPGLSIGLYIWKGMIPAAVGNMIGGTVFCAGYYYYMYLHAEADIALDGTYYATQARLEEGTMSTSTLQGGQNGEMSGNTTSVDLKSGQN